MKVYRIRDKVSGLFSLGGYRQDWNKEGKIWKNIGHVKNHLHQMSGWDSEARKEIIRIPDEWEIINKGSHQLGTSSERKMCGGIRRLCEPC